jgi:cell division protein FtsB
MLTRNNDVAPQQKYYSDSLLQKPTVGQSVFDNMAMGFATTFIAANMLSGHYAGQPEGQAISDSLEALQMENNTPGMSTSQWLTAQGSNMLGMGLNPATWFLGEAGGAIGKGVSKGVGLAAESAEGGLMTSASAMFRKPLSEMVGKKVGQYVPSTIGKELAEKPLTLGLMGEKAASTFGTFAGAGVPQAIAENYKADTDHIAWGGVARDMGEMGAFGIAIGSIPFGWGVLRGKINRGLGRDPTEAVAASDIDAALEKGHITKDEHAWYMDYLEHQKNPGDTKVAEDLKQRASDIINTNGHRANTVSNEAMFEMLSPEDMQNLQGVIADQVSGGVPEEYNKALSDFVIHNRMDTIREKPEMLDGVRGYVDFINQKLENKNPKLAEADKILDDHLEKGINENLPFSQKQLFKHMRQAGFEESHVKQLPVTIPDAIAKRLKINENVAVLEKENSTLRRKNDQARNPKYTDEIKDNSKRISVLKRNMRDYLAKMNRSEEAHGDVKDWEARIASYEAKNVELHAKDKLIKSGKRYLEKIAKNEAKIEKLKSSAPKLLTPKEELRQLRQDLLAGREPNDVERTPAYHRLVDLAHVWHNARTLLDRVHLEHEYKRQEAFRDLAHQTLKIADSDQTRIAKPENVVDYLKRRIEGSRNTVESLPEVTAAVQESQRVPTDADAILDEQSRQIEKSEAKEAREEFDTSAAKVKEFKQSENIFKNTILCVLGALGGG